MLKTYDVLSMYDHSGVTNRRKQKSQAERNAYMYLKYYLVNENTIYSVQMHGTTEGSPTKCWKISHICPIY